MKFLYSFVLVGLCTVPDVTARTGGGGGVKPDGTPPPKPTEPSSAPSSFLQPSIPSVSPAGPPSDEGSNCRTTNGDYGDLSGEPLIVNWKYAVSLTDDVSESDFTSSLLPQLETAMNNALLPTLFECPQRERQLRDLRRLAGTVIGITAKPTDTIEADVPCSGSNCHGLLGMLTLFLDSSARRDLQDTSSHIVAVRTAMKDNMDAGKFNSEFGPILTVTWVSDDGESGLENPGTTAPSDTPSSGANSYLVAWITGSIGFAVLIVGGVLYSKRRRDLQEQSDFEALDGSVTIGS
jgi:hypothetical protein